MARRLPASLELTISALALATIVGLPAGIAAAALANSWFYHLVRVIATLGVAIPTFFAGLMLLHVFYFDLDWAPAPLGRLSSFAVPPPRVTCFYLIDSLLGISRTPPGARNDDNYRSNRLRLPVLSDDGRKLIERSSDV